MDSNMIENKITPNREDGPSVIYPNGTQEWHLNGMPHREDGPAVIYSDGEERWYQYGKLHREDGPAVTRSDGTQEWWLNGISHDRISNKISFNIITNHNIKDGF